MHLLGVKARGYKRFDDLMISDLPATARLVVLTGPNGSGKSSVFDAFTTWSGSPGYDKEYHEKQGSISRERHELVSIAFHEPLPANQDDRRKIFYIRSAYRHEADFTTASLERMGSIWQAPKPRKMIDPDAVVSDNYKRLVATSLQNLYNTEFNDITIQQLRERLIGDIQKTMHRVFSDLLLVSVGNPLEKGSFFFEKGTSARFHYKNLSGGEKAAFDILLDVITKRGVYDDSVYCIDEPELHMHTRLQGLLLEELISLIPPQSQLWISTHSIGMMRKARDIAVRHPDQVVFLDFGGQDFDTPVTIGPAKVDREFWGKMLGVALDDLASLVAPRRVVLCEGRPSYAAGDPKAEFDARCYRTIFGQEYTDTDFLSVGNEHEVRTDTQGLGRAISLLVKGTLVIRVVDRDDRSQNEVEELKRASIRVLSKRHLEAYLFDDEVLIKLCNSLGKSDKAQEVLDAKAKAIETIRAQGRPADDIKSAAGLIYVEVKRILNLVGHGNSAEAFQRDTLAPLITHGMDVYEELKRNIFDE
jgi:predicted ATPase